MKSLFLSYVILTNLVVVSCAPASPLVNLALSNLMGESRLNSPWNSRLAGNVNLANINIPGQANVPWRVDIISKRKNKPQPKLTDFIETLAAYRRGGR